MPSNKQQIGKWGEGQAVQWLQEHGYRIVEQNYFARVGEIDIIARHTQTGRLCFIEVKTRRKRDGTAEYANNAAKQQKSLQAAMLYCQEHDIDVDRTRMSFEHLSVYTNELDQMIDHYIL